MLLLWVDRPWPRGRHSCRRRASVHANTTEQAIAAALYFIGRPSGLRVRPLHNLARSCVELRQAARHPAHAAPGWRPAARRVRVRWTPPAGVRVADPRFGGIDGTMSRCSSDVRMCRVRRGAGPGHNRNTGLDTGAGRRDCRDPRDGTMASGEAAEDMSVAVAPSAADIQFNTAQRRMMSSSFTIPGTEQHAK